jgi:hypothetical protein
MSFMAGPSARLIQPFIAGGCYSFMQTLGLKVFTYLARSQRNQLELLTLSNRLPNSPSNAAAASPMTT